MSTMRIRAAVLDVTITADGPGAGSPEVGAVMAQLRELMRPSRCPWPSSLDGTAATAAPPPP